jgi:hypothetical protein
LSKRDILDEGGWKTVFMNEDQNSWMNFGEQFDPMRFFHFGDDVESMIVAEFC